MPFAASNSPFYLNYVSVDDLSRMMQKTQRAEKIHGLLEGTPQGYIYAPVQLSWQLLKVSSVLARYMAYR
jgi:hypothetical protein